MLRHLTLANFRALKSVDIELDMVNAFMGVNEGGKSSIASAIEFALTGTNEHTRDNRAGLKHQIRDGANKAEVELMLYLESDQAVNHLRRTIPSTPGVEQAQAQLAALIGPPEVVRLMLRTRYFFDGRLTEAEQKDLLIRLLGEATPEESVMRALVEADPGRDLGVFAAKQFPGRVDLEEWYALAQERRKVARREMGDLAPHTPEVMGAPAADPFDGMDLKALAQHKVTLRERRDEVMLRLGEMRTPPPSERKRIQKAIAVAQERADRLDADLKSRTVDDAKTETALSEATAKLDTLTQQMDDAAKQATEALSGTCASLEHCALAFARQQRQREDELRPKAGRARKERQAASDAHSQAMAMKHQRDGWLRQIQEAHARINDLMRQLEQMEPDADPAWTDEERKALNDRANALSWDMDQVTQRMERLQAEKKGQVAREKRQKDYEKKVSEVESWEALVKALGPKGIRFSLLANALRGFQAKVNLLLKHFEMSLDIQLDPWHILVRRRGAPTLPVDQLSFSARARVSAVFQAAIARQRNFPFILVDEHGCGKAERAVLLDFLLWLSEGSPRLQSMVFFTLHEGDGDGNPLLPEDPGIDGLAFWLCDAGTVRRITPKEASPCPKTPVIESPPRSNSNSSAPTVAAPS